MQTPIRAQRKDVAKLIDATFPEYRGRTFKVEARRSVMLHDLNWSGGSRSQYRACSLDGQFAGSADKHNATAPWENKAEGQSVEIPRGACLVRHSIFCGKDTGLTFYINPEDMPRLLQSA